MNSRLAALLFAVAALSAPLAPGEQTYATRGVVKKATPTEIVVSRPKNRGDITIALSETTHVDGRIRAGAVVSIRYHDDHGRHIATAVSVEPPH